MQAIRPDQTLSSLYPDNRPAIPDEALASHINNQATQSPWNAYPVDYVMDQEIASMVAARQKASEYWRREKRIIWDKCWDHYKQVYDATGKDGWQSTMFMPETPKVVETIVANLYATSMAPHTPVEYQSNLPGFDQPVKNHNAIIANDLDKGNFKLGWMDFLRSGVVLGTTVAKVTYELEKKMVLVKKRNRMAALNPLFQAVGASPVSAEKSTPQELTVKDWAKFANRDLYDIYPEPYTSDIDDKHWIIEKAKITNAELIDGANDPDPAMRLRNISQALLSRNNDSRIQSDPEKQARRLAMMQQQVSMNYLDPDAPHELYEYWGPVPELWIFPERKSDPQAKYRMVPAWIWVVDKQWVVRKSLNPFRDALPPYVRGHYIRVPGQWYGIGAAELMIGLQIELNELRNTRVDQTNLTLNKIMAVLKDKIPPGEYNRLKSAPGAIWLFEGIDDVRKAIQPIEYPAAGQDAYMNSNEIKQEIQEVTAATNATVGVGGQEGDAGGKTFRGQLLNKQSAADRFSLYARGFEIEGLAEATRKIYQRIYQYKSYDQLTLVLGQDAQNFDFIPPEQLDQIAKLVPLGVLTTESKGVKLAQLEAFDGQFKGQWWYKQMEVARKECNEMGYPSPDQFIFSDEEVQIYNQQKQQMLGIDPNNMSGGAAGTPPGAPGSAPMGGNPQMGMQAPQGMGGPQNAMPQRHQPIAGDVPRHTQEFGARPAMPARGPGAAQIDMTGRPLG